MAIVVMNNGDEKDDDEYANDCIYDYETDYDDKVIMIRMSTMLRLIMMKRMVIIISTVMRVIISILLYDLLYVSLWKISLLN